MKHLQVVDGADNCIYPIYAVEDADFALIFPQLGQDIAFADEIVRRLGGDIAAGRLIAKVTAKHLDKKSVTGIHGTLFIDLPRRAKYFPTHRESDVFVP